jgi:putative radical SAM enzyme (TIGR03279 family)
VWGSVQLEVGRNVVTKAPGGVIDVVEAGSLGEQAGLQPGDRLVAINDQPLRDVIDVQFYAAEEELDLLVERDGTQWIIRVEREYDQDLGLSFVNPTFDVDIRRCANNCDFCFVKQNPPGARKSLYIKDDDYRHSFLFGNFVTLTNLTPEDWARLEEQRLSPLYVSVHATDLDLRRRFLAHKSAPDILEQLGWLSELGIEVHSQVVLVPGLNDGPHLDRTLTDLVSLYGAPVVSVGVVPIGLTKYHTGQCRIYTRRESQQVLDQLEPWRLRCRRKWGQTFVYPSDEWYLVVGRDVPAARTYDGFVQLENGVGMVRQLLDEWQMLRAKLPKAGLRPGVLACGTLIAPVLSRIVAELNAQVGSEVRVAPVENRVFGPVTTVSGLLTGEDVVGTLKGQQPGDVVLVPRAMFTGRYGAGSAPPGTTLDEMHITDLARELGVEVRMAGTLTEALAALAFS